DGIDVCFKNINIDTLYSFEHGIGTFFYSGSLSNDPRNHCVPILETLQVPDDEKLVVIVMPLLRKYAQPRSETFGEAMDFFTQIFEGFNDHNVAHRDLNDSNIMMDGLKMFPTGYHPLYPKPSRDFYSGRAKFYTRTQRPPKYYTIDFRLSSYETRNPPPLEPPGAGDKTVPEFEFAEDGSPPKPCNPFPTDVCYLGNMILKDFVEVYPDKLYGLEFMRALATDMATKDPTRRPTIDEAVERFTGIRNRLNFWKLRSRVVKAYGFPDPRRPWKHWCLRIGYILRRVPAITSYN
ncbi:hypothetical protein FB451DRAFT_1040556, partial [Mycena latifolia]